MTYYEIETARGTLEHNDYAIEYKTDSLQDMIDYVQRLQRIHDETKDDLALVRVYKYRNGKGSIVINNVIF